MRHLKLQIEYDGTCYCGWQSQAVRCRVPSIQGTIEKAFRKITGEEVRVYGSGRTDAGVHATGQVAHVSLSSGLAAERLQEALNALLPSGIRITGVSDCPEGFHSRYSAASKRYRYTVLNGPHRSAFLDRYSLFFPGKLNVALMAREARSLCGTHDFRGFCSSGSGARTTVRTVTHASVRRAPYVPLPLVRIVGRSSLVMIEVEANGFLYRMVRSIAGTLIDVGRGKLEPGAVCRVLRSGKRAGAGRVAAARGLCLVKVSYK